MEVFTHLRQAFKTCAKISELVTRDLIRGKLLERKDALSDHFEQALDGLVFDSEELNEKQFMNEVARHEKHALHSFCNLLYRQQTNDVVDHREDIATRLQQAIDSEDMGKDEIKDILKEARKLYLPDLDLYIPPKDKNTWLRFRNCTNAFYEVVTDPVISMQSPAEILIANSDMRQYIGDLEREQNDLKMYKDRFEALEKSQAPEYEKIVATLKKQLAMSRQDGINLRTDIAKQKQQMDLYQQYVDGMFGKETLEDELHKVKAKASAFDVKLKRIKIVKKKNQRRSNSPTNKPLSIKEL